MEFRREYLVRLPLPLAQLYSRAHNAKDGRSRHDNAFYLLEALVKLAATPLIAGYLHEVQHGKPRALALDRLLAQLALPSLGQWVAMLRELSRHFGERPDAPSHPLGHVWAQLNAPRRDLADLLKLYRRIKNGPDGQPGGDLSCSLLQMTDALVQYRNGVFGHGGPRFESFYAEQMGPLLFPAVNDLLAEGTFDLLGPRGSRLVYLTELRTVDEGQVEVGLRELVGLQGERLTPVTLSAAQAATLLPNRVAVLWPGWPIPLRLDPLLIYRESETAEEVLFLNRDRNGKQVEYLSYTTGRTERDKSTVPALAALLSLVVNRPVSEAELQALAERSQTETPSVEALFEPASPPGRQLGDYEILAELGRGGMGVVYLARQQSLGRLVALKMLPADLAGDEVALARFRREIRHLAHCEHPNIVKVLASGTMPDGQLFYTMEYVPGCDLEALRRELAGADGHGTVSTLGQSTWARAVLAASRKQREQTARSGGGTSTGEDTMPGPAPRAVGSATATVPLPLPPLPELPSMTDDPGGYVRRVVQLVRDAALAVQAVHDQQIIHRDVKPANLMLTPDGSRVVLMDFGLAKGQSAGLSASRQGGLLGTLRYAAPEQLAAATLKVGPPADVHALGCTLWELLTRRQLFGEAQDEAQLAQKVHDEDVPRLRAIDPSLDRDLEAIAARATERRVADRIPTAGRMAEYLQLYLEGKPLPIRPPSTAEMVGRWVRAHKGLVGSATAAALVMLATVGLAFVLIVRALDRESEERQRVEEQKRNLESALYFHSIALADREWFDNHLGKAEELLDGCPRRLRGWEWHHLKRLGHADLATLSGPPGEPTSVAFSRDGRFLACGGGWFKELYDGAGELKVWDVAAGVSSSPRWALRGHDHQVKSVVFSPDSSRLVSAGWVYDPATFGSIAEFKVWDAASGRLLLTFRGHKDSVGCLAFSPDGKRLASAGEDATVRIWDPSTGRELLSFRPLALGVTSVAFSPDGKQVAAAGRGDSRVTVHDLAADRTRYFEGHTKDATSVAFGPDGMRLASASEDQTVRLWDLISGDSRVLRGHVLEVTSVAFSPDGARLASASKDETVRVWDAADGHELLTCRGHTGVVVSVAFSSDGARLASAAQDGSIKVWDAVVNPVARVLRGHTREIDCAAFSPDGQRLASGGWDQTIRVWDTATGREAKVLRGHSHFVESVAFSPDGRQLASGSHDQMVMIWNLERGEARTLFGHEGIVSRVVFSPDGKRLASASRGSLVPFAGVKEKPGEIKLWDPVTEKEVLALRGLKGMVLDLAFSPDGKHLASAGEEEFDKGGEVRIWDPASGEKLRLLRGTGAVRTSVTFSRDGQLLASGGGDATILVWNAATGEELFRLKGHTGAVTRVAFSADGTRLASASTDQTVKLWDTATGKEVLTLRGHTGSISEVVFSPDGRRLASASWDKTVRVWDGTPWDESPDAKADP